MFFFRANRSFVGNPLVVCCLAVLLMVCALWASWGRGAEANRLACWVDIYRGEPILYPDVLDDLAGVQVIYLGERHTLARHHDLQTQLVADLARRDVPLVLALEQLEARQQPTLDRYAAGEIDFDELAQQLGWEESWHNYRQYRPVVESARQAKAPILALNAPQETIRAVFRQGGVEKLSDELRAHLPQKMQLDDPAYEKLLGIMLSVHLAATPQWMRPMMEAQIARDEHMAEVLANYLQSPPGRGRTAIVLVGAGHVNYGLGLAARVRTRMPDGKDRIVIMSESGDVELSAAERAASREIEVTHEQLRGLEHPIADYLHVTSLGEPEKK